MRKIQLRQFECDHIKTNSDLPYCTVRHDSVGQAIFQKSIPRLFQVSLVYKTSDTQQCRKSQSHKADQKVKICGRKLQLTNVIDYRGLTVDPQIKGGREGLETEVVCNVSFVHVDGVRPLICISLSLVLRARYYNIYRNTVLDNIIILTSRLSSQIYSRTRVMDGCMGVPVDKIIIVLHYLWSVQNSRASPSNANCVRRGWSAAK